MARAGQDVPAADRPGPVPTRARRRSGVARTLRGRLTLSLVAVLVAAFVVTGAATAVFLRGFLLDRLDAQLAAAGGRFSTSLEHGQPSNGASGTGTATGTGPAAGTATGTSDGDADNAVSGQSVGTLGVRLLGGRVAQAAVVGSTGKDRTPAFPAGDVTALRALPVGGGPRSTHLQAVGDYRLEAVAGRDGDVQVTGLPLHEVDETVARLAAIEGALFLGVVVVSGVATTLVVRRNLLPLRRVAETALEVADLPLTDAGTPLPAGIHPPHASTEVDQVSVAFDRMLDHVRRALVARDLTEGRLRQFVADASHELRTPLATIQAYAEYGSRTEERVPESTSTALHRIDTAAIRMGTLVDDLLLLARLDAGRPLARTRVDLTRLVVEAVSDARTTSPGHRWRLDLPDEPVDTVGDGDRLHQVVANLLSNARTHTPPGSTVTVTVRRAPSGVDLSVGDDGPGIPSGSQDGLFDRFTRGDPSRSPGHGSTGLGLAIAHSIATAHHGTLTVRSRPGATCFRLWLPDLPVEVGVGVEVD